MASPAKLRWRAPGVSTGGPVGGGAGGIPIPADYFAMQIGRLPATTIWGDYDPAAAAAWVQTPWPEIGIGALRIWDSDGTSWRNIERSQGNYSWGRLDVYLAQAAARGVPILCHLGQGPDWATTAQGQRAGLYVGYNPHPPASDAYWVNWCTALAMHVVSKGFTGAAYEVWNEVNDNTFGPGAVGCGWTGTVAQLVHLADLARTAIRAVDPTAIMLSPNFIGAEGLVGSASDGRVTLDKYITAGGMAYADVVSLHAYNTVAPFPRPESMIGYGRLAKNLLAAAGIAKPVWITEWGYGTWQDAAGGYRSTPGGYGTASPDPMPDQQAADYITRMLMLTWAAGFDRMYYYAFDALGWASQRMIEPDYKTLKPAAIAFAYMRNLLVGGYLSVPNKRVSGGIEYYRASFTTPAGRIGYALWCDDYATAAVAISDAIEVRSNTGVAIAPTATVAVTGSPKFVFLT